MFLAGCYAGISRADNTAKDLQLPRPVNGRTAGVYSSGRWRRKRRRSMATGNGREKWSSSSRCWNSGRNRITKSCCLHRADRLSAASNSYYFTFIHLQSHVFLILQVCSLKENILANILLLVRCWTYWRVLWRSVSTATYAWTVQRWLVVDNHWSRALIMYVGLCCTDEITLRIT